MTPNPDVGALVEVRVQPRTSRTEVTGAIDGRIKIRLKAPPVDGAANRELVRFVAKTLGLPRSDVTITKGDTGRNKTLRVAGLSREEVFSLLTGT